MSRKNGTQIQLVTLAMTCAVTSAGGILWDVRTAHVKPRRRGLFPEESCIGSIEKEPMENACTSAKQPEQS